MPLFSAASYCIRCFQSSLVPAAADAAADAFAAAVAAAVAVADSWYVFAAALRVA